MEMGGHVTVHVTWLVMQGLTVNSGIWNSWLFALLVVMWLTPDIQNVRVCDGSRHTCINYVIKNKIILIDFWLLH